MALNGSGPISLGGATAGQSINLENGQSATAQVSLNDSAVRSLAGVASGAIIMPTNFYGKSNAFAFTISSNQTNANLRTLAVAAGWNQSSAVVATVAGGVYVYSTSIGTPGLTINGSWPGGIALVNNGFIIGMGGAGGSNINWYNINGESGGSAISLGINVSITNNSYIAGGGGGGGGNGIGSFSGFQIGGYLGGGGGAGGGIGNHTYIDNENTGGVISNQASGGGPGSPGANGESVSLGFYSGSAYGYAGSGGGRILPGSGGVGSSATNSSGGGAGGGGGGAEADGSVLSGGNGGSANNGGGSNSAGGGGGWGASGGSGSGDGGSGAGGAGGKAVALNGYSVTWVANGIRYGAIS